MSQRKLWKPLAASLAIVTLGAATPATAQEAVPSTGAQPLLNAAQVLDAADLSKTDTVLPEAAIAATPPSPRPVASSITELYEYEIEGRDAVTLYVRDIPIATFVDVENTGAKRAQAGDRSAAAPVSTAVSGAESSEDLTAAAGLSDQPQACADVVRPTTTEPNSPTQGLGTIGTSCAATASPVRERAIAAAERINEFHRAGNSASEIQLQWDGQNTQYQVLADNTPLLVVDAGVQGPEPAPTLSDDALQVTNRLRRQIGNAPPLVYEGQRRTRATVFGGSAVDNLGGEALGAGTTVAVRSVAEGYASWYGPGFHGRRTASGEVFNQNAMTAAHRTLPFGTRVRVINLNNGQSTVVRITDRGPFIHNRIVDLSAGAARAVGLYSAGVGRVRLEILAE